MLPMCTLGTTGELDVDRVPQGCHLRYEDDKYGSHVVGVLWWVCVCV